MLPDEDGGQADERRQHAGARPEGGMPLPQPPGKGGEMDGEGLEAVHTGEDIEGLVVGIDDAAQGGDPTKIILSKDSKTNNGMRHRAVKSPPSPLSSGRRSTRLGQRMKIPRQSRIPGKSAAAWRAKRRLSVRLIYSSGRGT